MKLPRDLGGAELVKHLCRNHGYTVVHQEGSHIVLETKAPCPHRLAVPNHSPVRVGTLNSILRAVAAAKRIDKADVLRGY
ncbi:MAG: type II toxin-antitoxin system HicA family toxin [Limisphaerales bacterium]